MSINLLKKINHYINTLKWLKQHINHVCGGDKNWCFFNMITPDPTLILPLQWWKSTPDLKFFHTLSTAWIWHHRTYGCLHLSKNISKKFISHVMMKFKLLQEYGFKESLNNAKAMSSKKLDDHWQCCIQQEGDYVKKIRYRNRVHILSYTLFWCPVWE